ncbi:MAG: tRNA nucleotidyltransferase [Clostridia bacterium]|nr:tRNA nucleotidyltransferase [Clostridia bacterium]
MNDLMMAENIAKEVKKHGGTAYFVGGYVRDRLLSIESKDIDIEIHGVEVSVLKEILDSFGERISMGEHFGIFALRGYGLDIALPRKEKAIGKGHRDFETFCDPMIGTYEAAKRRDFTINALMMDVLSGEIIDHFGGREDLERRILRHVSEETFPEDALRVLRGAQFAARFHCTVARETTALCKKMSLSSLSHERVWEELRKALMKSDRPSVFFRVLREMNQLGIWFPEVEQLIGVKQNPVYHAEGDVFCHTMMVLDEAAKYRESVSDPFGFMLTALCHDFGKAICTEIVKGKICSYNHETLGLPLIETFLKRLTNETKRIHYVLNLTEFHMRPNALASFGSSEKATNKMFDSVQCAKDLVYFAKSDHFGRITSAESAFHEDFLWERLRIYEDLIQKPRVMGKDLIAAGLKPDLRFAELLSYAHKLHLAGVEKEEALKQTLSYARKNSKRERLT